MNIAAFSIKRPIFISSIVFLLMIVGYFSIKRMGVDMFPDVNIPFVTVMTTYPGAGPEEIEELVSKPMEEEYASISGIKRISSFSQEGVSLVMCEFVLSADIKDAEQQVRNKLSRIRAQLPDGLDEPIITRFDPADQPIVRLSLTADNTVNAGELYDIARDSVKIPLEQVANMGAVRIMGGVEREIQVEIDRNKLNTFNIAALWVANALKNWGLNVPVGKHEKGASEVSFRTIGRFEKLSQVENAVVSFGADAGSSVKLRQLATVRDGTEDATTMASLYGPTLEETERFEKALKNGKKIDPKTLHRESKMALFLDVYKQSGANTVEVAEQTIAKVKVINEHLKKIDGNAQLTVARDGSRAIRMNIDSVSFDLILGILLAIIVVYFFLGNVRSTIITGLAIPDSILGAFIIMLAMGFTINLMTLLALTLVIGLLVDDAIVVRENIFKKLEAGVPTVEAAEKGTREVLLAVIATSVTVIAVFLPIGFLQGMVGQFLKQFGLTVVFALIISTFDALTIAPMLSAYFAGKGVHTKRNFLIRGFDKVQDYIDKLYDKAMHFTLKRPLLVIGIAMAVFLGSCGSLSFVKKTFMPPNDMGEFMVFIEMPPGTSLEGTKTVVDKIEAEFKAIPEIDMLSTVVGTTDGLTNQATMTVKMVDAKWRKVSTNDMKVHFREILKNYEYAKPSVNEFSPVGGAGVKPFNLNLMGEDLAALEKYAAELQVKLSEIPDLIDVDTDSRPGKPEFQIKLIPEQMQQVGVTPGIAGAELRYHIAGGVVGKFYEGGREYDIRMRLKKEQRDLKSSFYQTKVPNQNNRLIPLRFISKGENATGPARITRQDRSRILQIRANLSPDGAIDNAEKAALALMTGPMKPPPGITYMFWGQAQDFKELVENILLAFGLALLFIYLALSSLYESFITPITILVAIPPAISGAFLSLAITGQMLNIFSMIGVILLIGLVTKNSILLVDYAVIGIRHGMTRAEAIYRAGQLRLRPILMTSFAMIAGIFPIALGLDEVAKMRQSMGIAIIGGLIISTLITLFVVPAVFGGIDKLREAIERRFRPDYDMSKVGRSEVEEENPFDDLDALVGHRMGPPVVKGDVAVFARRDSSKDVTHEVNPKTPIKKARTKKNA